MSRDVIGPALKLARTVLNLTQQQAGETIGISPKASKNVYALYERGAREPGPERISKVVAFVDYATAILERQRSPRPAGGIERDVPVMLLDELPIGDVSELQPV